MKTKLSPGMKTAFMYYSRFLFRTSDIVNNHLARVLMNKNALKREDVRQTLAEMNKRRARMQRFLNNIGSKHTHVCADCKGKCCGGKRERDAFIDRIIQYPDTQHLQARRKAGDMVPYNFAKDRFLDAEAPPATDHGCCPELTMKGCKIPYELRPIQCVAYFCGPTVDQLPKRDAKLGIQAVAELMKIQMKVVGLAARSRFMK